MVTGRTPWQLLGDPHIGIVFWVKTAGNFANWAYTIVVAMVMYQVTGSALLVGLISVAQYVPQIVAAPYSGYLVDRGHPRTQMLVGFAVTAFGALLLAVWLWIVGGASDLPTPIPILVSSAIVGLGYVIGGPPSQTVLPRLVESWEVPSIMALNSVPMTLARSMGPALGAVAALHLGSDVVILTTGLVWLACALALLGLRVPASAPPIDGDDLSLRSALAYLRRDRPTSLLLLGIAAVGVAAEPAVTLAPAIAAAADGPADLAGWIASAFGLGAMIGLVLLSPAFRRLGPERSAVTGLCAMGAGVAIAAIGMHPIIPLSGMLVAGVGMTLALTNNTTLIQMRVPDAMRGRIMAVWFLSFLGARPLGSLLAGWLTDVASVAVALLATAVIVFAIAWSNRPKALGEGE